MDTNLADRYEDSAFREEGNDWLAAWQSKNHRNHVRSLLLVVRVNRERQGSVTLTHACLTASTDRSLKCTGTAPCDACAGRGTNCVYDQASDQRRKIAAPTIYTAYYYNDRVVVG